MKSILLTTTAIVAFAGAAVADGHTSVGFSGDATLGYNDDIEDGFFWNSDLDVTFTAALDNGVTASASFGFEVVEDELGNNSVDSENYVLSISTENASLSFGDVDPVAEANYGGVDGDTTTGFFDQDAHFDTVGFDAMLVGEVTVADITAMLSYGVFTNTPGGDLDVVDAMQLYVSGDLGMISAELAYQAEVDDAGSDAVMGVSASTTIAGAELTAAYINDGTETSTGIAAAYPVGPVTVGGYYSMNDVAEDNYGVSADYVAGAVAVNVFYDFEGGTSSADTDDTTEFGVEGSYDTGMGLTVLAGYISTDAAGTETAATYVAGVYDLGGGAELLVSYAEDEANATNDEIGDPEYNHGTTVAVSFSF